jgi:hypothetical protein
MPEGRWLRRLAVGVGENHGSGIAARAAYQGRDDVKEKTRECVEALAKRHPEKRVIDVVT